MSTAEPRGPSRDPAPHPSRDAASHPSRRRTARARARSARGSAWRAVVVTGAAYVLLGGLAVLERLDAAVAQMHPPAGVAGGVGAVASPASLLRPEHAVEVARGWRDWPGRGGLTVGETLAAYVAVDVVVALVLAAVLWRVVQGRLAAEAGAPAVGAILRGSRVATVLYVLADWAETAGVGLSWPDAGPAAMRAIGFASLVKWLSLGLVAAALAIVAVRHAARPEEGPVAGAPAAAAVRLSRRAQRYGAQLVALRGHLVVLGVLLLILLGLTGNVGRQVDDVVVRTFERPALAVGSALAAVVCSVVLWLACHATIAAYRRAPLPGRVGPRAFALRGAGGAAAVLVGGALLGGERVVGDHAALGAPLVVAGAVALLSFLLDLPRGVRDHVPPAGSHAPVGTTVVPHVVAAPLVALSLAVARALVRVVVDGGSLWPTAAWVVLLGVLAATAAGLVAAGRPVGGSASGEARRLAGWWVAGAAVTVAGAALGTGVPMAVGSVTVLLLGLAGTTVTVTALVLLGDAWPARGALSVVRVRRVPVLTLALVLAVGASMLDREARYYDARLLPGTEVARVGLRPADRWLDPPPDAPAAPGTPTALDRRCRAPGTLSALEQWICRQPRGTVAEPVTVPLVLVSASGGGVRAAYWTGLAVECLFGAQPPHRELADLCAGPLPPTSVFLASAVSGSSTGLAMVRAAGPDGGAWVERAFDEDYLAPALAAAVFRDVPNSVLRLPWTGNDRAAMLEAAWERGLPGMADGFAASAYAPDGSLRFPLLLFNGTSVADGCRFAVSVVRGLEASADVDPDCVTLSRFTRPDGGGVDTADGVLAATKDAFSSTCPPGDGPRRAHDVRLSTAAMLSARFPYMSPTAGLHGCTQGSRSDVLDGGLVDNSGADALLEVWQAIEPTVAAYNARPDAQLCIVPRLVMLDSGFVSVGQRAESGRSWQAIAPGIGALGAYGNRSSGAQQEAVLAVQRSARTTAAACRGRGPAVAHLFPEARPGTQAPLGWTLARGSQAVLRAELAGEGNRRALADVRRWYPGTGS